MVAPTAGSTGVDPPSGAGDPLRGVSSSFDYVSLRELPGFVLDPVRCTALQLGLAGRDSSRFLVALVNDRYILCTTRTRDFDDIAVRHVVHTCGQLYLDVSGKLQIDDFATDVQQLSIADVCRSCPHLPRCSATYVPEPRDFFAEDETWIRDRLQQMRGAVLDVGAGHLPYLDALASLISGGSVVLHALDPDPVTASPALPLIHHQAHVETAQFPDASFDACLAIRSLNHFTDVERALANIARWLRPGAPLLLVESLPLPLLRPRRIAARAHARASGGFQHYHNWESHDVLRLVSGNLPFHPVHHRPIGRDTTDQWILELIRV